MSGTALPTFFVAGVPKAGTTTLYEYLARHPQVFMSRVKEPAFFSDDRQFGRGLDFYCRTYFAGCAGHRAVGEATPWYLYVPNAWSRMREALPGSSWRFVIMLRDPVDRAYSMYWDQVHAGHEQRDPATALREDAAKPLRLDDEWQATYRNSYMRCGRYEAFIEWMREALPGAHFLLLDQGGLRQPERRARLLDAVARFLDLDPTAFARDDLHLNPPTAPRSVVFQRLLVRPRIGREPRLRRFARALIPRSARRSAAQLAQRINAVPVAYPPLPADLRRELTPYYAATHRFLECLSDDGWRLLGS